MSAYRIMLLMPLLAVLFWAAVTDLRHRRIANWLTLSLIFSGLLQTVLVRTDLTLGGAALGMLAGLALTFVPFALGALAGGDAKLMAGVGAWLGAMGALQVFLLAAMVGLVIVLVQCAAQGRLTVLFRNSAVLALNFAHIKDVGVDHVSETGKSFRSIDRPLPYAVPVLAAVLILIAASWHRL